MIRQAETRVLLVEADGDDARELCGLIESGGTDGFSVEWVDNIDDGLELLRDDAVDLAILGLTDPRRQGLDALAAMRECAPQIPIVVMAERVDDETAARTMREGAQDCLIKAHVDASGLAKALRYAQERKYSEQALRESEQRFRRVFEEGTLGMALVGTDFTLVGVNNAFCSTLGYSREELLGQSFSSVTHPDDLDADDRLSQSLKGDLPCSQVEKRYLTKDGSVMWGNQTASVVRGDDGAALYGIVMVEDITERRRAEEAVRRSLNLLHAVVGGTTDAVFVKDREGRYLLLNSVAAQLVGKPAAEIVGKTDAELFPPDVAKQIMDSDREIMEAGETRTLEENLNAQGITRTFLSTKGVYRDECSRVIGLFGVARDITDRTQAEEELRRSEAKYRELIERATYGMCRYALDGRFVRVNPALTHMLGYETEGGLLTAEREGAQHWDPAERQRLVDLARSGQRIEGVEVEWYKCDGDRIQVRLSGHPVFDDNGTMDGLEIIAENVTERRVLEAELRQAQKMQAIGELTGGIAHDLNNILTVVTTNLDLMGSSLSEQQAELKQDVDETQAAVRRGTALIKKLLGFSRRGHLEIQPVHVVSLVADLFLMLRRIVPESIQMNLQTDAKAGTVRADAGALEQILLNLVTNARDAMVDGGLLSISVGGRDLGHEYCATHPWTTPGKYVCISVSDSGIGMEEETRERVFEPFFTTKPPELGTGLGLSMVYGLVKQHGGVVDVISKKGAGTTVNLYLPQVHESAVGVKRPTPVQNMLGGIETILVVEDEETIRRAARRVLEKHGYTVLLAADGQEALQLYPDHRDDIDLVISDVVMPRLGGAKFYEALLKSGGQPKILFTSGYTDRDVRQTGAIDPALPFIHKPWTVAALLSKIREVLDSEPVSGDSISAP
jgi:two-component system cell cycle sensor histidine kinase/response regulator CckA